MKHITHKSDMKTVLLAVCVNVGLMPDNGNGHLTCCMLSFVWFPGVRILYADVSEHSVCSVFTGR